MGFGPAPGYQTDADMEDVREAVDAIERVMRDLSRIGPILSAAGAALSAVYVEGASDALAFAIEAALSGAVGLNGPSGLFLGLIGVRLRPTGVGPYASAEGPPVPPPGSAGPSLGSTLLADPAIVDRLRSDELAASLMTATLSHSDWIHLGTDAVFRGDELAARGIVSTIAGRDTFASWTRRQMGGMVDRSSSDLLARLGWRRMTGASLPDVGEDVP